IRVIVEISGKGFCEDEFSFILTKNPTRKTSWVFCCKTDAVSKNEVGLSGMKNSEFVSAVNENEKLENGKSSIKKLIGALVQRPECPDNYRGGCGFESRRHRLKKVGSRQ